MPQIKGKWANIANITTSNISPNTTQITHIPLFCILRRFKRLLFSDDKYIQNKKIIQQRAGKWANMVIIVISSTYTTQNTSHTHFSL